MRKAKQAAVALHALRALHGSRRPPPADVGQTTEEANWDNDGGGQGAALTQGETVRAIRSTFSFRYLLDGGIGVVDRDGLVILSGEVQDSYAYWLAEYTAAYCLGVKKVRNRIAIKQRYADGSDGWIEFSIGRALTAKALGRDCVSVSSKSGSVAIDGWASNLARKGQVEACAWETAGVRSVSNRIKIGSSAPLSTVKMDDPSIVGLVRCALQQNPLTRALNARVTSCDGFLVIAGIAASEAEKSLGAVLAHGICGVKSVTNDVFVKC